MFYCKKCNMSLPDGANVCPYCGEVQNNRNTYEQIPNTPHNTSLSTSYYTGEMKPQYGTNPYSPDEGERFLFQQRLTESINDAATAKALGTVSVICGILASFFIVCWICGAIGIAKAKSAMDFAQRTGNSQLYDEAKRALKLNRTGLIISAAVIFVAVFGFLMFSMIIGLQTST